jgi:hypothetical protein
MESLALIPDINIHNLKCILDSHVLLRGFFEYSATYYAVMRMILLRCTKSRVASLKNSKTHIWPDTHNFLSFVFQQYVSQNHGAQAEFYIHCHAMFLSGGARTLITENQTHFETPSIVSLYTHNTADQREKILTKIHTSSIAQPAVWMARTWAWTGSFSVYHKSTMT